MRMTTDEHSHTRARTQGSTPSWEEFCGRDSQYRASMQKVLEHEFGQEESGNGMELYFCVSERVDGKVRIMSCLVLLVCVCVFFFVRPLHIWLLPFFAGAVALNRIGCVCSRWGASALASVSTGVWNVAVIWLMLSCEPVLAYVQLAFTLHKEVGR